MAAKRDVEALGYKVVEICLGVTFSRSAISFGVSFWLLCQYKKCANVVGGRKTSKPSEVHAHMKALLEKYNALNIVTIEDIISFHAEFEYIHSFQDGNGRVGRLVALKECLNHSVVPFIIEDSKKNYYYRGLTEWRNEKCWLTDTCLDGQDTFVKLLDILEISIK